MAARPLGEEYFARYGVPAERMFPFPYEPDYEQIASLSQDQIDREAERFSLPLSRRLIVYSGRLAAEKRVDLLIDAFVRIASDRPEWDLVVIGGGPLDGQLHARVPAELAQRVRWIGFLDDQAAISRSARRTSGFTLRGKPGRLGSTGTWRPRYSVFQCRTLPNSTAASSSRLWPVATTS